MSEPQNVATAAGLFDMSEAAMQDLYNQALLPPASPGLERPLQEPTASREMLIAKNPLEDKHSRAGPKDGQSQSQTMEFVAWGDYAFEPDVKAIFMEAGPGYVYEMSAKETKVYEVNITNCPSSRLLVTPPAYSGRKPIEEDVETEVYLEDSTGRYGPYGTYTFRGIDNSKSRSLLEFLKTEFMGEVAIPAAKQEKLRLLLDQAEQLLDAQEAQASTPMQPALDGAKGKGNAGGQGTKRLGALMKFEADPGAGVKRRRIAFDKVGASSASMPPPLRQEQLQQNGPVGGAWAPAPVVK